MTPEYLQSLSSARGIGVPIGEETKVNELQYLLERERTRTATGKQTSVYRRPSWSMAECAQACVDMDARYFYALRYSYALDETVYSMLRLWLWEWALERREAEDWPNKIATVYGHQRFLMPLVEAALQEEIHGGRIPIVLDYCLSREAGIHMAKPESVIRSMLGITDKIWSRRVSPIYEAIRTEYLVWRSIGEGHMRRWLNEEAVA